MRHRCDPARDAVGVTLPSKLKLRIRKGLDLQIPGAPVQTIENAAAARAVALLGHDFPQQRLSLEVSEGDRVRIGQVLFRDRGDERIRFVSPASGTVAAIRRGDARRLLAVEIACAGTESVEFPRIGLDALRTWTHEQTAQYLLESGDWISLRTRPFGSLADPDARPGAIFVRAMDSNPLAADAAVVLDGREQDLTFGLTALARMTDGPLYLCCRPGTAVPQDDVDRLTVVELTGPHPAGLVGTHVHQIFPVSRTRRVWYVGYQDVLAIGRLLRTGRPDPSRVIALAGPAVRRPRLLRTVIGAASDGLVNGEIAGEPCRIISGSLLSGRIAAGPAAFLGRYHEQVCAISDRARPSGHAPRRISRQHSSERWSTELHGQRSAFLPLDGLDDVFPLRLPLSPLLRALSAGDSHGAETMGALEIEEEDLALASYLCPAKLEHGRLLRAALDQLQQAPR